jgi:long-chain fatty acid transport protein
MFNIIAPGVVKNHWTAGFTTNVSKNGSLDFSFSYAPSVEITGDHPFAGASQQITIEMEQYEIGANYTWKY